MSDNAPIISFKNVSKEYTLYKNEKERFRALFIRPKNAKKHLALNGVDLQINKGESVGIIGDNGAGKSTLLKMITGVTFPSVGDVSVQGKVAALLELTAGFSLEMSGRENIYLKGYILGLKDDYIKTIEEDIIDFAELGDYIDQPVRTYSSGMKMRLGFAINVNIEPDILVIDEALSVGDATFKRKCKNKIAEIIQKGTTVLFVSHSIDSVKEMCPRAVYLKKGQVVFDGDVEEAAKIYKENKNTPKKK
ncbi:MAG TPA: ABC transporter ATP-binding protein [Clostridiales bacterium]|nr:ABC transporter ATP-binding protein [Clostridiales bacterium]